MVQVHTANAEADRGGCGARGCKRALGMQGGIPFSPKQGWRCCAKQCSLGYLSPSRRMRRHAWVNTRLHGTAEVPTCVTGSRQLNAQHDAYSSVPGWCRWRMRDSREQLLAAAAAPAWRLSPHLQPAHGTGWIQTLFASLSDSLLRSDVCCPDNWTATRKLTLLPAHDWRDGAPCAALPAVPGAGRWQPWAGERRPAGRGCSGAAWPGV